MTLTTSTKRKATTHQKKRSGSHQHGHKHFHKTYWPYLPMLLVVGIGLLCNSLWSGQAKSVLGYATDISETQLLQDTNTERSAAQLGSLELNDQLQAAAQAKANDMVSRNYWSHDTPEGKQPWAFIKESGYNYQSAGENLAYGFATSKDTVTGWMNSPGHRENLLKPIFTQVGFGIASSPDFNGSGPSTIVVAMYGQPTPQAISLKATVPETTLNTPQVASTKQLQADAVSRIELITGDASSWILGIGVTVLSVGLLVTAAAHSRAWHRRLVQGEAFVLHHPIIDIVVLAGATALIVLSQTSGFIQ